MQYKVTWQYAKEEETPLAEFIEYDDAIIFVNSKSFFDEKQTIKLIYRIYDHNHLINEINKDKIKVSITKAKYAECVVDLPEYFKISFSVIKDGSSNEKIIAKFNNIDDARIFIKAKIELETDKNEIYLIFKFNRFVEKIDKIFLDSQKGQSESSQGKEKKVAFRPTPFNMTLRLGPKKWLIDEDDDDDEKNEK